MNRNVSSATLLLFALIFSSGTGLNAQTTAPTGSSSGTPSASPNGLNEEGDVIQLSPFVVSADEDQGYSAKATLAGTRIRTELKDVGSSISVITQKFLQDTNSTKAAELLVYTPNTEVAGQGGNYLGKGDGQVLTGISTNLNPSTRVRGLTEADNARDFFLTDIPWDSYNVGRVDLQRGPNSILFGIGSPGGIMNASINTASFRDSYKATINFGSFGSQRYTLDFNKVLIPRQLAIRVSALDDETKYRQEPAFRDDKRIYAAGRWDPSFLNKGSVHTSFRVSYEKGKIDANMPRNTPPLDAITQWFSKIDPSKPAKPTYAGPEVETPSTCRLTQMVPRVPHCFPRWIRILRSASAISTSGWEPTRNLQWIPDS